MGNKDPRGDPVATTATTAAASTAAAATAAAADLPDLL